VRANSQDQLERVLLIRLQRAQLGARIHLRVGDSRQSFPILEDLQAPDVRLGQRQRRPLQRHARLRNMSQFQIRRCWRVQPVLLQDRILEGPKVLELGFLGSKIPVDGNVDDGSGRYAGRKEEGGEFDQMSPVSNQDL
jgi:hypothetical protein